ncbi:MAG: sigma-54-dependent transcriptional regulator [Phenylobacterium sp.]|jgi:sigma-54-dependent transcriptional regulator
MDCRHVEPSHPTVIFLIYVTVMNDFIESPLLALEQFISAGLAMSRERDHQKQLHIIATAARHFTSAEAGCIYLLDKTKCYLVPQLVQGELLSHARVPLATVSLFANNKPNMSDISAYCALSGQLVNVADIYRYSGFDFSSYYENDRLLGEKTVSILAVPLTDNAGTSIGVMQLINRRESESGPIDAFPLELENMVKAFAAQVAITVDNSRLLAENQALISQMEKLNKTLAIENQQLKALITQSLNLDSVIGASAAMKKVYNLIEKVSSSKATVLLRGETGTGKELIAEAIHKNSPAAGGLFVAQNCAALPADLLESEMFGYKKGAFSGATSNKKGLFELANDGTLFLDEIGDMSMALQTKLLRVLQEGKLRPLGGTEEINVNARVIAATHCPLELLIKEGKFREDLYYRLNVFPIDLPAIRDRQEDIPALVSYFLNKYSDSYGKSITGLSPKVLDAFTEYPFPGNVRELQNIMERAILLADADGVIKLEHLPLSIQELGLQQESVVEGSGISTSNEDSEPSELKAIVARFEAKIVRQKLQENGGNQTLTAQQLGVSRRTLVDKVSKYQLR